MVPSRWASVCVTSLSCKNSALELRKCVLSDDKILYLPIWGDSLLPNQAPLQYKTYFLVGPCSNSLARLFRDTMGQEEMGKIPCAILDPNQNTFSLPIYCHLVTGKKPLQVSLRKACGTDKPFLYIQRKRKTIDRSSYNDTLRVFKILY